MADIVISPPRSRSQTVAARTLDLTVKFWFSVTVIGQWVFVYYLSAYYISRILTGGMAALAETRLPGGYVAGDTIGNLVVTLHLFVAVIIIGLGPLQFIPSVQRLFPKVHRWNGRLYIVISILTSLAGLHMTWVRGDNIGNFVQHVAVTLNAALIIIFAIMAWRSALERDFKAHRRWALRLFMVVSAVWLLRIGYQLWNLLNNGVINYDPAVFRSNFMMLWNFGQYLLPLLMLELYLFVQHHASMHGQLLFAVILFVATVLTCLGIYTAAFGMWLPRL